MASRTKTTRIATHRDAQMIGDPAGDAAQQPPAAPAGTASDARRRVGDHGTMVTAP